ncbi:MAG: DNA polymerase III subunit delta [Paracoccaceae bacterium]
MKLSGPAAARFLARPDAGAPGLLLFGADPMRVALKRAEAVAAIVGPGGEADMRVTRIAAADLRRDPALLADALRARGFFPGPRAVVLEDAGDGHAPAVAEAIAGWAGGDGQLVVTAGQLKPASALRKLFEGHPAAPAIGVYDDPPSREEIGRIVAAAGIGRIAPAAMEALAALAAAQDPGDFRQTVGKLALYTLGAEAPVGAEDVAAIAPSGVEADLDEVLAAAAEGRAGALPDLIRRLGPKTDMGRVATLANQHFRLLLTLRSDPAGAEAAAGRIRPPLFGPRRDRLLRQAKGCGAVALTGAIAALTETELALRSSPRVPGAALVERALLRIAHRVREEAERPSGQPAGRG